MMDSMETTTLALTDFLRARIADDLDTAEHVVEGLAELPHKPGSISFNGREVYDLRRVTRDLEAKLRIVEGVQPYGEFDDLFAPEILGVLASVYSDHPDYREEWRT